MHDDYRALTERISVPDGLSEKVLSAAGGKKRRRPLAGAAVCAAAAINTLMAALRCVPSSLLYPMGAGCLLVTSTLLSCLVLKERLTLPQGLGIATAIAGVVLTNL